MHKARILIVEDEGVHVLALESMLTESGHVVLEPVATGEDAIAAVRNEQPDLVLMNIGLAGKMDGITAARHIQSISDIPILYVTGHLDEDLLKRAGMPRPYCCLAKPVSARELKVCLEMALRQHALKNIQKYDKDT